MKKLRQMIENCLKELKENDNTKIVDEIWKKDDLK